MKKLVLLVVSLLLCFSFSACGGNDKNDDTTAEGTDTVKVEKNIDAVAEELGLTGGEETLYEFIGATAGKEYNDGEVELYQFDTDSSAYSEIESSGEISGLKVSAYKDGIALIFANEENSDIIKAFENISFK